MVKCCVNDIETKTLPFLPFKKYFHMQTQKTKYIPRRVKQIFQSAHAARGRKSAYVLWKLNQVKENPF